MRNGFQVYDSDTHINPAAEVLDKYVDPDFRPRLPELAPYRVPIGQAVEGFSDMHNYRAGTRSYRRILGEAAPRETFSGRDSKWMGSRKPRPGVQDDQAENRLKDMDDEGTDAHFLIPTSWLSLVGVDDSSIEVAMIRAFHRHMADFCAPHPERLTGPIVASTRQVEEAVKEIRTWGKAKWAVAVMPLLAEGLPADHPSLEPIWREAAAHDLPIASHSFTWTPPYYPGYRDLYDNIFLGRLAAHPWGAMRFAASFIGGGLFDRYPALRMGVLECGFGWLPFWGKRMDEQAIYVGGTAPLKMKPSDYMKSGRFFCSIEHHEGEDMFEHVTKFLGDDVLMYASDYPHSECQFPDSVSNILEWSSLNADRQRKLLWGNANRFFRRT
jgi:predicted TIM-barrel fold metal-dependent hydrolase